MAATITGPDGADQPSPGPAPTATAGPAGRLRVYLGAAPGVGKTYAMLSEAHRRRGRGADVVVGFFESHGRSATEALVDGLEVVPRQVVQYRGSRFEEMDLDAVLGRRPEQVLVDELAHANVPGLGRHEKRWQDVMELLDAGIDVVTTVNIQHLASIADAVERIIEVPVRERVPDWVLRKADQIELVDSSPEQLRRRMAHGNIYAEDTAREALSHYFRADRLTALRELALRFVADDTEEQLLGYLRSRLDGTVWETHERILVGVTTAPGTDAIVRRAARMAQRIKAELDVLHVTGGGSGGGFPNDRLIALRQQVADVGAEWNEVRSDDPARALYEFARRQQATQIVLGSSRQSRWREVLGGGSVVAKVSRLAAPAAIDVHIIARRDAEPPASGVSPAASES